MKNKIELLKSKLQDLDAIELDSSQRYKNYYGSTRDKNILQLRKNIGQRLRSLINCNKLLTK